MCHRRRKTKIRLLRLGVQAVLLSPDARTSWPIATLYRPVQPSSHCAPVTTPARNAAFSGYHSIRVPGPSAGIALTEAIELPAKQKCTGFEHRHPHILVTVAHTYQRIRCLCIRNSQYKQRDYRSCN